MAGSAQEIEFQILRQANLAGSDTQHIFCLLQILLLRRDSLLLLLFFLGEEIQDLKAATIKPYFQTEGFRVL